MKKLLICLWVLFFVESKSQMWTAFDVADVNNFITWSGNYSVFADKIEASNLWLSGTSVVNFTAKESITLQPGFWAGSYTSNGYFLGTIGTGPITNAEVLGNTNVGSQFEKFEIGLNLSITLTNPATDYITPINNFITFPQNPDNYTIWDPINHPTGELDPYDPAQVLIKAVFTNQSSGDQFIRYGYYQEDAGPTSTTYTITPDQNFPFRIRFAPPDVGTCYAEILLYINGVLAPGPQPLIINFNVVPSTNPGDIEVSPTYTKSTEFDTLNAHDGIVNYPNPFTSQTTIEFSLKNDSPISLYVIDTKGNRIINIVSNQTFNKGGQVLSFNGTFLSSGVYYCILESNSGMKKVEMVKEK